VDESDSSKNNSTKGNNNRFPERSKTEMHVKTITNKKSLKQENSADDP
jgi:hypothetical protein